MRLMGEEWGDPAVRRAEVNAFNTFFSENYKIILTCQAEMKYFAPGTAVNNYLCPFLLCVSII